MGAVRKSGINEGRQARKGSPIDRRRRAAQGFMLRVAVLLLLMGGIAYAAWFAPWARPIRSLKVEMTQALGSGK